MTGINFDEVFDSVKESLGTAVNVVAEKSVGIKDAAVVKYKVFELKNDVKKLYTEIGKMTYEAAIGGEDKSDELKQLCATVKEKLAKIQQLESGMGDVEFKCPDCGMATSGVNSNCPNCGADMTVEANAEIENKDF